MFTIRSLARLWPAVGILALLTALAAPAAADTTGPIQGYGGGTFVDVKSPPLADGETFTATWGIHFTGTPNYAGLVFVVFYDPSETSALGVAAAGPHFLTFGTATVTAWHNNAANSGVNPAPSSVLSVFRLTGAAINTTTANNSDVDLLISAWRIIHIPDTTFFTLQMSDLVYVTPLGFQKEFVPGNGVWSHATFGGTTFITASAFVARQISNVAGYGIEHVPEPISVSLLLAGIGMVAFRPQRRA
jgi:hypothetical protein